MKTKRVIISGANGYFGGIACRYFESRGWNVLKALRQETADIYFDLNQPNDFSKMKLDIEVDLFIHAAAAHEVTCSINPYLSICQNIVGTKAALDFCVTNDIKQFVYLSTFHVFGHPSGIINELSQALPQNDYGLSHLQAEEYVNMYTRHQKVKGTVIRPSNFFGVPIDLEKFNRWTLVPVAFCKEAIETGKIVLNTPGYQLRNFVSIADICKVIESLCVFKNEVPLLHVAGPDTFGIRFLAKLIQKVLNFHFDRKIELIIPDGLPCEDKFSYESLYLDNIYRPADRVEDFIIDFCKEIKR